MQRRQSIEKVLIANRGEIAVRIAGTCRRMGIATVAVFSDADADAPAVRACDEAVRLGPPAASESYLAQDKIVAAAALTGADAIHPGYGFLAENSAFAAACATAGLTFIGPTAEVIRLLGSKQESKRVVAEAGVPVIPGYGGNAQDAATLAAEAEKIGFPVLLKASAGGGGKGMYLVHRTSELASAIDSAKRVSASAFGDDTLLVEKYIERPRHVEIQILGDQHGSIIHLFERECSIQRRHQKIIEESPSPALSPALREEMGRAAVAVGRAVGYYSAGTVEFILAPDGRFYFLEVNTRLQVEHPVTECVTGLDLVREQIRIAEGHPLEVSDLTMRGAAVECRLYAEDAEHDFRPAAGRIVDWHVPNLPGLRVDSGVESGTEVGIHYDPMLAKVISYAPTRAEAIALLTHALRLLSVQGLVTNRELLLRVLTHPDFAAGALDTHFLERHAEALAAPAPAPELINTAAMAATLVAHQQRRDCRAILPTLEPGFRNNPGAEEKVCYRWRDQVFDVGYRNLGGNRLRFNIDGDSASLVLVSLRDHELTWEDEHGHRRRTRVVADGERWHVQHDGHALTLIELPQFPTAEAEAISGGCVAPMPGKVVKLNAVEGEAVSAGDTLAILEAMKMEHAVRAPTDGVVTKVAVQEGEQVEADQLLVVVDSAEA